MSSSPSSSTSSSSSSAAHGGAILAPANTTATAYTAYLSLLESADKKFSLVRDLPSRGPTNSSQLLIHHAYRKAFSAFTRLWDFQRRRRTDLISAGLRRTDIAFIASKIAQLYYSLYIRSSEIRFLFGSFVFYEAILVRNYFELDEKEKMKKDVVLGLRYKELRYLARFVVVAMLLRKRDAVREIVDRFKKVLDQSKIEFPEINFKEWKLVLQEITRFIYVDISFTSTKPLRFSLSSDTHPSSLHHIARFEAKAKKVLKLKDALLTSYHRNEVKFAEITLDSFRMLQCLEWEPSSAVHQVPTNEKSENGVLNDQNGTSGLIDINLAADMTDSSLPPNPQKTVLYHPTVSHLISVLALICEELPSESIMLLYLSASGHVDKNVAFPKDRSKTLSGSLTSKPYAQGSGERNRILDEPPGEGKPRPDNRSEGYLCFAQGEVEVSFRNIIYHCSTNLYPEDLIPFTRKPLFLIIDSDNSQAFKAIHGAERGEPTALLLSPMKPSSPSAINLPFIGSQFTFFLTCPLQAFCQLIGVSQNIDSEVDHQASTALSSAFCEWEVTLCTSDGLDPVWAQVLPDPFLRRLIVRYIFCRAVLSLMCPIDRGSEYLPSCFPNLPESVSPESLTVQSHIFSLAEALNVISFFCFSDHICGSYS